MTGGSTEALVVAARGLPMPLRDAGQWMQRLAEQHPDAGLSAAQDGQHVLVLTPAGRAARDCGCGSCYSAYRQAFAAAAGDPALSVMGVLIVCPSCGNKRCPRASHHDNPCTGSNEPGQPGSAYAGDPVRELLSNEGRALDLFARVAWQAVYGSPLTDASSWHQELWRIACCDQHTAILTALLEVADGC